MQPSWNLLSCSRPHHVTPKKPRKTNGFFKDFGICSPLGISCLAVALIIRPSKHLEKPMVFEAFANMQASWNLLSSSRPHYVTFRKPRKTNGF